MITDPDQIYSQDFKSITLEKCRMAFEQILSADQLAQLEIIPPREMFGGLAFRVERSSFGEHKREDVEVQFEFPSSWWQHFKQQHFPKWLLKRFPVVMKKHRGKYRVDARFYFPDLPIDHADPNLRVYIPYVSALDHRFLRS